MNATKRFIALAVLLVAVVGAIAVTKATTAFSAGSARLAPGTVVGGTAERETLPQVDRESFEQFSADNRDFAFTLFERVRDEEGESENVLLSPHSVSIALAMAFAGAANDTRQEMADALRFRLEGEELHRAFNRLDLELASRSGDGVERFELEIVNQMWGHQESSFEREFLELLAGQYGAAMQVVNFEEDFESIRREINDWVEARTNDRISDLLPSGSVNALTRLILVNAVYFYGSWKHPFEERRTRDQPFHRLDGSVQTIPLMVKTASLGHHIGDDTVAVSIPYVGDHTSLIAFMPADSDADFLAWERQMNRASFDEVVGSLRRSELVLYLPRFRFEGQYDIADSLQALGMGDAFHSCRADFRAINGVLPCQEMRSFFISGIFQKTFVAVNEEGTEAAAATAVVMETTEEEREVPPTVRFDRPFNYVIYDHPTDTILFMGRLVDVP